MNLTLANLVQRALGSIVDPRQAARDVMALDLTRRNRWDILTLVIVLSAVLAQLTLVMAGQQGAPEMAAPAFTNSPIALGAVQAFLLLAMVFGIHLVGKKAGGTGSLDDAIILVAWLQFIMIVLQVIQSVLLFTIAPLAMLIGLAGIVIFFWLLANFVAEMHGFKSLGGVLVGIFLTLIVFAIILSFVLAFAGILPEGVPADV